MIYNLKNDVLNVNINATGAELRNVLDINSGFEYMWQADPKIWARTAPVLFPIVGKLKDDKIGVEGRSYSMTQHGFARDMVFHVNDQSSEHIVLSLKSSERTKQYYPDEFVLYLSYQLKANTLICTYEVVNTGNGEMYFSIGAHPGFNLVGEKLNDYEIEFEQAETLSRWLLEGGLFTGKTEEILDQKKNLSLNKELFYKDALVFKNLQSKRLTLKHKQLGHSIKMQYAGFPYFGIWSKRDCESFLCLEPWCGLSDNVNGNLNISDKEGIIRLSPNEIFNRSYSITFNV